MKKVKLKVIIESNDVSSVNEINASFDEKKRILKYIEDDSTNVKLDMINNVLIRENNDMYMKFFFDIEKIIKNEILIKELNKKMKICIKTTDIIDNNLEYIIKYNVVDGDSFKYSIKFIDNN